MTFKMVESFNQLFKNVNNNIIEEVEEKLTLTESNQVTNQLPPALDNFLMDMAQMYCDFDYQDIRKFADRASEDDIKKVSNIRRSIERRFNNGYQEDDPSLINLFNRLNEIIKNSNIDIEEGIFSKKEGKLDTSKLHEYDRATKYYAEQVYNLLKKKYDVIAYAKNSIAIRGLKKDITQMLNKEIKVRPQVDNFFNDIVFELNMGTADTMYYIFNEIEKEKSKEELKKEQEDQDYLDSITDVRLVSSYEQDKKLVFEDNFLNYFGEEEFDKSVKPEIKKLGSKKKIKLKK